MPPAPTRTVYLRSGMKFRAYVGKNKGKGKGKVRPKHVVLTGPCEVEMTETQILAFKDLLQTTPSVLADAPVEKIKAEEPDGAGSRTEDEDSDSVDEAEDEDEAMAAE